MPTYPKYVLTGKTPAATYEQLVQYNVESASLVNGDGNSLPQLNITTSFATSASVAVLSFNSTSSSYAETSSYATNYINFISHSAQSDTASYLNPGANLYLSQSYIIVDTGSDIPPQQEGLMYWDKNSHTYAIWTNSSGVSIQIGQTTYIRAVAGEYIPAQSAVYIDGSTSPGGLPIVFLALANGLGNEKSVVCGIVKNAANINDEIFIATNGELTNLNTFTFNDGDRLYLSPTTSGSFQNFKPSNPYEKVNIGIITYAHPTIGKILIEIQNASNLNFSFVGMTTTPTYINNNNGTFTVGSASANFCTTIDGLGEIKNYIIPPTTFSSSVGPFTTFIAATYNNGNPIYQLSLDRNIIDDIQTIGVASSITFPVDSGTFTAFEDWGSSGTLLANKEHLRTLDIRPIERINGLILESSGSRYITISSGSIWYGVNKKNIDAVDTFLTSSNRLTLYNHLSGSWTTEFLLSGQYINDQYDDGYNLHTLSSGSYVINYVYRTTGAPTALIVLSNEIVNLTEANVSIPPEPPANFIDFSPLIGRIIIQSGSNTPYRVDSIFNNSPFMTDELPHHNDIQELQGGTGNQYYHLTFNEYTGSGGSGSFVRQDNIINLSKTSSYSLFAETASFSIVTQVTQSIASASVFASQSISSSYSVNSDTASFLPVGNYSITSSNAISSSWTPNLYPQIEQLSASWASASISASWSPNQDATTLVTASTYQITASWAITAVNGGTQLITASTYPITSSNAISSSYAQNSPATTLVTASTYQVTSSWSNNTITSSYVSDTFSKGGTFYDPTGLAGSASFSQNVIVWRAPFNCSITNIWGCMTGGTNSTASINARKNGIGTIATGSNITLTTTDAWVSASSLIAASSSFVVGDKLEIMLISSSGFPTQISVQIDLIK